MTQKEKVEHIILVVLKDCYDENINRFRNLTQEEFDKKKEEFLRIE